MADWQPIEPQAPEGQRSWEQSRAVAAHGVGETGVPIQPTSGARDLLRKLLAPVAFVGLLLAKFAKVALLLFKLKFVGTALSMLVSIGAYTLIWGWRFAAGFVALMFVHEMGHAIQMRREGLRTSPIVFIPFLGAMIAMKDMPRNALVEARVGLAGPILGTVGAIATYALARQYNSALLMAIAYTAFFLNLFNLLPVSPLDGGRAMAALSPKLWILGVLGIVAIAVAFPNPIIVIIAIIAAFETWGRWRRRHEDAAYYGAVTRSQRIAVAAVYLGLAAVIVYGMDLSFVPRSLPR